MADENEIANPQVLLHKLYLKGLSFKSPQPAHVYTPDTVAETMINVQSTNAEIDAERVEVTLKLAVKGVAGEQTIFELEAVQAGLFSIQGYTPEQRTEILGRFCPETLFPFARNAIAAAAAKGGYPNVLIKPLDFAAMFSENMRERAAGSTAN